MDFMPRSFCANNLGWLWFEREEQEKCYKMAENQDPHPRFPDKTSEGACVTGTSSYLVFQINGEVRFKGLRFHFVCKPIQKKQITRWNM